VQPGVTLAELNTACSPAGLHFPVDPSSGARCTLGGMLANNSAGSHSVKYGSVRAWTQAVDAVLATGERVRVERGRRPEHPGLRAILDRVDAAVLPASAEIEARWPRVRKNSSGYALLDYLRTGAAVDLLVGSEGTLALLVGGTLRLAPRPSRRGVAFLEFTSLEDAGAAVQAILPVEPATCEMLDRTFLELVRNAGADDAYPLRPGLEAILIVEMEGDSDAEVQEGLQRVQAAARGRASRVVLATDPGERERLWEIRHAASPIIAREAGHRVSMQFIEDGVVPVDRLPDYVRVLRRVLAEHGLPAVIFGHAGDGNLHVNPLVDVHAPGWRETLEAVLAEIAEEIAALGGTLSGEHGDGRLRAPYLRTIWGGRLLDLFREVKEAFDPKGILNPGVKVPLPGQRPFSALRRYD
jgi:FAD/FMN-containing dehydrogenase